MLKRVITAAVCLAVFIPVLIFSGDCPWLFIILMTVLPVVAIYEICGCIGVRRRWFLAAPSYLAAILMIILPVYFITEKSTFRYIPVLFFIVFMYIFIVFSGSMLTRGTIRFSQAGELVSLTAYIVIGFLSILLLRYSESGQYLYMLIFIGAWSTDTGAYLVGSTLGRHKLIPEVSPNKTVEGALGGILFCAVGYMLYGFVLYKLYDGTVNFIALLILSVVVSVVDQLGDLVASYIKREQGIKDYGNIFPGHGGVLDRFDSIIAIAPVVYTVVLSKLVVFFS